MHTGLSLAALGAAAAASWQACESGGVSSLGGAETLQQVLTDAADASSKANQGEEHARDRDHEARCPRFLFQRALPRELLPLRKTSAFAQVGTLLGTTGAVC